MPSIREQLRNHAVAITSLIVALTSLGYNTWRNERTEHNRNMRAAAFEMLTKLAEFERVVFLAHYDRDSANGNPRTGWTYVIVMNDLAQVMPQSVQTRAVALRETWRANWEELGKDGDTAIDRIDGSIANLRQAALDSLRSLR
ncbi:MAG TPA: hypothetical protein VLX90_02175 [Steroidobacteraceae bacterium]|nr:hypothetical protein [Steroidobacteraceae bacterium]